MRINLRNRWKSWITSGESSINHKAIILDAYHNLMNNRLFSQLYTNHTSWVTREIAVEAAIRDNVEFGRTPQFLTPKEKNDIYVARILADHDLLKEAAQFYCDVFRFYTSDNVKPKMRRLLGKWLPQESQHNWPCPPDLSRADAMCFPGGQSWCGRNLENRGYSQMIKTYSSQHKVQTGALAGAGMGLAYGAYGGTLLGPVGTVGGAAIGALGGATVGLAAKAWGWYWSPRSEAGMEPGSTGWGLLKTVTHMNTLAQKDAPYSDDDVGYILRGMLLLRDINKMEKHERDGGMREWSKGEGKSLYKDRVDGYGVIQSRTKEARYKHYASASLLGGDVSPRKWQNSIRSCYTVENPERDSPFTVHDYIQGMSGSTLDYSNWVAYVLSGGTSRVDVHKVMRLFQVNYAGWHAVTPDGMAHSQVESLSTLCALYLNHRLSDAIMVPIKTDADTRSMMTEKRNETDRMAYLIPTSTTAPSTTRSVPGIHVRAASTATHVPQLPLLDDRVRDPAFQQWLDENFAA